MEKVIDELEMISSPLADSEDSLISEMSTKYDVARSSWLEMKRWREDDDVELYTPPPPPIPQKDYSRVRPHVYRRRNEEFNLRRSKSYDKPRPPRPRTPEQNYFARNARYMVNKKLKDDDIDQIVYATPIRKTPNNMNNVTKNEPIIEEFNELPRYVKTELIEKEPEENQEKTPKNLPPKLDLDSEIEFSSSSSSSKVVMVEQKLKALRLAREDSLSNLLKKQLTKKEEKNGLPVYVEPKDPIMKELQEFLRIEPSTVKSPQKNNGNGVKQSDSKDSKTVEADEHRLVVRGWQNLIKTPSTTSSTSSSSTIV